MANLRSSSPILIAAVLLILGFFSIPIAAGRPCKALFITFTVEPIRPQHPNPNTFIFSDPRNHPNSDNQFVSESILIVDRRPNFIPFDHRGEFLLPRLELEAEKPQQPTFLGLFPIEGIHFDSLSDRIKHMMRLVVALLFGAGCGALISVTLYFAWTLFVGRADDEEEEFYYSKYDDIPSPKKSGYVKIPEAVKVTAAPVKEVI